jgi:hypothetical protein
MKKLSLLLLANNLLLKKLLRTLLRSSTSDIATMDVCSIHQLQPCNHHDITK